MSERWLEADWPAPPAVRTLVTTRAGGFSSGRYAGFNLGDHVGDDPADVLRNRARLDQIAGVNVPWLKQVHGVEVVDWDAPPAVALPQADAALCRSRGRACAVLTADCLPVLFCDRRATVVAAAHAGWRGLAAGVLETTIARMGVAAGDVIAWLGPAIGPAAFEVGDEVRAAFLADCAAAAPAFRAGAREGKWMADLFALARLRLERAGVGSIHGGGVCTYADEARFYSYRRDGETGRFASLVWLAD